MTAIPHSPDPYLPIYKSDATLLQQGRNGVTLTSGTTYYVAFGAEGALIQSVHLQWDPALILTAVTVEDSNNPDAAIASATAGEWIQEDPATAYVGGIGNLTVTNLTLAVAGGAAGGAMIHLGNLGSLRQRLKIVVGGTGGIIKITGHARQ